MNLNTVRENVPTLIHELTPKQYREAYLKGLRAEYSLTRKEAEEGVCIDFEITHFEACQKAAHNGVELRRQVLDAMAPGLRRSILHDFPNLHRNYMLPEARKMNQEREARIRKGRKEAAGINLLNLNDEELRQRMQGLGTGCYTEQDGGDWYIVTQDHSDRIGEDFAKRSDARRFMCVLAGDPMPKGWTLTPTGDGHLSFELNVGNSYGATVWTRATLALIRRMNFTTLPLFGIKEDAQ